MMCSWLLMIINVNAATHRPQDFLAQIQGKHQEGEQIVHHFCATCHARRPIIELGAPKIAKATDWDARVKQGLDNLFKHVAQGYNAMPARGGCFECSDLQLKLAIIAILPPGALK